MGVGAYKSLISLLQDLDRLQQLRAHGKIVFDALHIQNFQEKIHSLLSFLEGTNSQKLSSESEDLFLRLSLLTVEAEVIIGEHIVEQFRGISSQGVTSLSQALNGVIREIESIYEALVNLGVNDKADPDYSDDLAIENVPFEWEDQLKWVMDKLTNEEETLQIIPIFGKARVGKTALARTVYNHPYIQERFDKLMWWFTMSENFDLKHILEVLLGQTGYGEALELGLQLHQKLHGRKYLIVMDDVQEVNEWDRLKLHLPDTGKGSRIIVTTSNLDVAHYLSTDENYCALDYNRRLYVLKKTDGSSHKTEEIGKDIAEQRSTDSTTLVDGSSHKTEEIGKDIAAQRSTDSTTLVGFENVVRQLMDRISSFDRDLQVISIVGMGGMGKTTIARYLFNLPPVEARFDKLMWSTISQEYSVKQVLQDLLGFKSNHEIQELGIQLHKKLYGRRYLVVLDDMWEVDAWESLRPYLPDNMSGSRVILTTRHTDVAYYVSQDRDLAFALDRLDDNESWNLLRTKIFGKDNCPLVLENIGKKIARRCGGLPLSLVAMAGVLSKSNIQVIGRIF